MRLAIEVALLALSVPVLLAAGYLGLLTLFSGRPKGVAPSGLPQFDIIVPAHNEEAGISGTVRNLLALDYPKDRFRVRVVADNCTDDTAGRASAEGADVWARNDSGNRGKGHALAHAFARSQADAVVVVDADTVASPNLLRAFAARLATGAQAIQADYAVQNPEASWRTRLMAIALGMFHIVRSRGRERLGLSCGLRGNGMCFATTLFRTVPYQAFSVVEDSEFGIALGLAGHRVHYADDAHVWGEMVSDGTKARSQRARWEGGRKQMRVTWTGPLLREAFLRRSPLLMDLAFDVAVPPLGTLATGTAVGALTSALNLFSGGSAWPLAAFGLCAAILALHVARGWALSGTGWGGARALLLAPAYLAWKWTVRAKPTEWIRTARRGESG